MARVGGRQYNELRKTFRAACAEVDAPCWMDGQPIAYDVPDSSTDDSFELDHYYPVSTHPQLEMDPGNFRPSHRLCNRTRGNGMPQPPINGRSRVWEKPPTRTPAPQPPASLSDYYAALREGNTP